MDTEYRPESAAAKAAIDALEAEFAAIPIPRLLPMLHGGWQLEWCVAGIGMEIELGGDPEDAMIVEAPDGQIVYSGPIDHGKVRATLVEMRRRRDASNPPAL